MRIQILHLTSIIKRNKANKCWYWNYHIKQKQITLFTLVTTPKDSICCLKIWVHRTMNCCRTCWLYLCHIVLKVWRPYFYAKDVSIQALKIPQLCIWIRNVINHIGKLKSNNYYGLKGLPRMVLNHSLQKEITPICYFITER